MTNCTATTPVTFPCPLCSLQSPSVGRACCCPGCRIVTSGLTPYTFANKISISTLLLVSVSGSLASTSSRIPSLDLVFFHLADLRFGLTEVIVLIVSSGPRVSPPGNLAMIAMLTQMLVILYCLAGGHRHGTVLCPGLKDCEHSPCYKLSSDVGISEV